MSVGRSPAVTGRGALWSTKIDNNTSNINMLYVSLTHWIARTRCAAKESWRSAVVIDGACLRRARLLESGATTSEREADQSGAASGVRATARILALRPPSLRSRFTALGEDKTIALFSVSIVQIVGLTVGSNDRWRPKIRSHDICVDT